MRKKKTRMKQWKVKISSEVEGFSGNTQHYMYFFLIDALNGKSAINKAEKEFHKHHAGFIMQSSAEEV